MSWLGGGAESLGTVANVVCLYIRLRSCARFYPGGKRSGHVNVSSHPFGSVSKAHFRKGHSFGEDAAGPAMPYAHFLGEGRHLFCESPKVGNPCPSTIAEGLLLKPPAMVREQLWREMSGSEFQLPT